MPEIIFLRYNQIQTILKVHYGTKEAIAEQIWCQINFFKNGSCIRSICLKTAPTIGVEISDKQKVTVLIRYLFYFNLTGIGFALTVMPLKHFFIFHFPLPPVLFTKKSQMMVWKKRRFFFLIWTLITYIKEGRQVRNCSFHSVSTHFYTQIHRY